MARARREERGSVLVEAALVLPVVLTLLLGVMEFGFIWKDKLAVSSAVRSGVRIGSYDGISDNGEEVFNFCEQEGIKNIAIMGVHTNMCVLGRSFGIRQMVRLGKNVVLARDLTDAMYDPRQPPHVSHARGTELVIEHVEKYWCPSVLGADLTRVVPGSAGPFPRAATGR